MRLFRFGEQGKERPAVELRDSVRKDCSSIFDDWNGAFFESDGMEKLKGMENEIMRLPDVAGDERIGSCISRPWKVICIGLNYSDHAEESGMEVSAEPVIFMKSSRTVTGPNDDILIPPGSKKTDWEVELGVIIGKECRYAKSDEEAQSSVAGYCISHDVSDREFQLERGGQWVKGKSCDSFNPLGPYLAPASRVADPQDLDLWLNVNGECRQRGNTRMMIFGVNEIVRHLSQFMTLEPGDLISTSTPPGVGMGRKPEIYLESGDVVELGIDGANSARHAGGSHDGEYLAEPISRSSSRCDGCCRWSGQRDCKQTDRRRRGGLVRGHQ